MTLVAALISDSILAVFICNANQSPSVLIPVLCVFILPPAPLWVLFLVVRVRILSLIHI